MTSQGFLIVFLAITTLFKAYDMLECNEKKMNYKAVYIVISAFEVIFYLALNAIGILFLSTEISIPTIQTHFMSGLFVVSTDFIHHKFKSFEILVYFIF